MQTTLIRSAVLAATRNVRDGKFKSDLRQNVRDAHLSIYDTEPDESTAEAKRDLQEAANLAGDLYNFGEVIRKASRK